MEKKYIYIGKIPAVIWGGHSEKVFLYVHGQGGNKEEAELIAGMVCPKSYQVISIDLPEHGERKNENTSFDPWHAVPELSEVMSYIKSKWKRVYLYANSIGAWFSMLSFADEEIEKFFFVSPIVDMVHLIANMMSWAGVTEDMLKREKLIETDFGQTLSYEYLLYAREHIITKWSSPTYILYGDKDNLTEPAIVNNFVERFKCSLTVMKDGEHWFHTEEEVEFLTGWFKSNMK